MDEKSSMYELEFPAPQISSSDGVGPVLVHGLEGFSDAGHAVKLATKHLRETLETELVASFDVDELIDYRSRRPTMSFKSDHFSDYDAPELNLYAVKDNTGTPFLLLSGMEPDLRWEKFTTAVRLLAEQLGVRRTIGLGSIPMAIPHTRPLGVTAHSSNKDLVPEDQSWSGELQVPGSASSLLELRMAQHGHESMGFSVHVPHYLAQTDYPAAAETLLENVSTAGELDLPLVALGQAAARVKEQVDEHITGNEEVQSVVHALERQYDTYVAAQEQQSTLLAKDQDLPSGDELGAEFEKFLAEQTGFGTESGAPTDPDATDDGHDNP
ncbi:proteasome assembly chaperone family protein [Rhodococcoides fascians]|uniref:proteasome assembly chaperone family protein n=1 Tax=Rhodococcoides fascians TaxID=1828 RepID=UPI00056890C3|nr:MULTISPECIES: PAC2 family protein [Rhodococcus]OZE94616.1 PAC2 family protein [Rhodococcus sp. 15-1189-1-1a]OZF09701.1 PAC2 family protein [Rhodococcus sp. 14-2686-1-2]